LALLWILREMGLPRRGIGLAKRGSFHRSKEKERPDGPP